MWSLFSSTRLPAILLLLWSTSWASGNFAITPRRLALGDFDSFNEAIRDLRLLVESPAPIETQLLFPLSMILSNVYCEDIRLGDMEGSYQENTETNELIYSLLANPFDTTCYADYSYTYEILFFPIRSSGRAKMRLSTNSLQLDFGFASSDGGFDNNPPNTTTVQNCVPAVNIDSIELSEGSVEAAIIDFLQGTVADLLEGQVATAICDAMAPANQFMNQMLEAVNSELEKYLITPVPETDPLALEREFVPPADTKLVQLLDTTEQDRVSTLLRELLAEADDFLSNVIDDPANPGQQDLAVNVFLRNTMLDDDGSFTVDFSDPTSGILTEGHDNLVKTRFKLETIKIRGLDSFRTFLPLEDIGNFTLSNAFAWEFLSMDIVLLVDIGISTLQDAILTSPTEIRTSERVQVSFDMNNLDVGAALFLAIDQARLNAFEVGRLLQFEDIFSCLFEIVVDLAIAELDVNVENIGDPSFDGFGSPGFDRILSSIVKAGFIMYRPTFLKVVPVAFAEDVRKMFNDDFIDDNLRSSTCPEPSLPDTYLDFRDLFLEPSEAQALGGSGSGQYGNLGQLAYSLFTNEMTYPDEDGLANINRLLIRPLTRDQSGSAGTIRVSSELLSLPDEIDLHGTKLALGLRNLRLENIDTIGLPLQLLEPTTSGSVLSSNFSAGVIDRPLSISMDLDLDLEGNLVEGGGASRNSVLIQSSLGSLSVGAAIEAWISTVRLLELPLEHLFSVECWIATMESHVMETDFVYGLGFAMLELATSEWNMNITCTDDQSCDMRGLVELPTTLTNLAFVERINDIKSGLESTISEIAESDFMKDAFDGMVSDAQSACPVAIDSTSRVQSPHSPPLPILSKSSQESLAAGGIFALELFWVVFAQTYDGVVLEETQPLAVVEGGDEGLIDFSDLEGSVGQTFAVIWNEALDFLSGTATAEDGSEDIGANVLFRSLPLDDGKLIIDLDARILGDANLGITLRSIRIGGLSTLTEFTLAESVGPQTFSNLFRWEQLDIDVVLAVGSDENVGESTEVTLSLGLADLRTAFSVLLALDSTKIKDLEVGQLLDTSSILPCLLSAARAAEIGQLSMSVGQITYISVSGFSGGAATAADSMTSSLLEQYGAVLPSAIQPLFGVTMKSMINSWMQSLVDEGNCPSVELSTDTFVDFRDLLLEEADSLRRGGRGDSRYGDLLPLVWNFVSNEMLSVNKAGYPAVNTRVLAPLTEMQSGTAGKLVLSGDLLGGEQKVDVFQAGIRFRISDLVIENIDTLGSPLILLDPVEGNVLANEGSIGVGRPMTVGMRLSFAVGDSVSNDLQISVKIEDLSLGLDVLVNIIEASFLRFPLRDVGNLHCWLATLPAPSLDNNGVRTTSSAKPFDFLQHSKSVDTLDLNVTCIECTSPTLPDITKLLTTPEGNRDATDVVDEILDWTVDVFGADFVKYTLDRMIVDAKYRCPHSPAYDPSAVARDYDPFQQAQNDDSIGLLVALAAVAATLLVSVAAVMTTIRYIVHRRHRKWVLTLSEQKIRRLLLVQDKTKEKETFVDTASTSMFSSPHIPRFVRYFMPVIIIGNIGLFLSGHLSDAASVTVFVSFAGDSFYQEDFFTFSIAKGTVNIWKGGGRELAVLILLFSGVWPYTKQIISLVCWFLPTRKMTTTRRGNTYRMLDALAKWSMIDIFTILVSLVSFQISAESPDVGFLPSDFYKLDLLVIPKLGLYANFVAQIVSQVSSHFIIHYHDREVRLANRSYHDKSLEEEQANATDDSSEPKPELDTFEEGQEEPLSSHGFARPHRGEKDLVVVRSTTSPILLATSAALSLLLVLGCTLPSFSLDLLGIVGVLIELGQNMEEAYIDFSLFTMVQKLFGQANFTNRAADYIGLGSLGGLMIVTVLIVPLVQTGVLLYLWLRPMTLKLKKRLITANEVLQAWQYAEVYALAIIFGSWQLGSTSEFMVNTYCDQQPTLKETFGFLAYFGIIDQSDAQCFRVKSDIEIGFYLLAAAALLLAFVNTFVKRATDQYLRDKTDVPALHDVVVLEKPMDVDEARQQILPPPTLFSDRFRWFLIRQDSSSLHIFPSFMDQSSWDAQSPNTPEDGSSADSSFNNTTNDDVPRKVDEEEKRVSFAVNDSEKVTFVAADEEELPFRKENDEASVFVDRSHRKPDPDAMVAVSKSVSEDESDIIVTSSLYPSKTPVQQQSPIRMSKTWSESDASPREDGFGELNWSPSADSALPRRQFANFDDISA